MSLEMAIDLLELELDGNEIIGDFASSDLPPDYYWWCEQFKLLGNHENPEANVMTFIEEDALLAASL